MPTTGPSLTLGGKVVVAAGLLFLVSTFLPWYSFSIEGLGMSESSSANAWKVDLAKIAALLVLVALAEVILTQVARVQLPGISPALLGLGRLVVSGIAALLVVVELVRGQDVDMPGTTALESLSAGLGAEVDLGIEYSFGRGFGMFAGLLFVLALVGGNVLRLRETPALSGPANPESQWGQSAQQPGPQFGYNPQQPTYGTPGGYGDEPQYGTPPQQGYNQQYPPQQGGQY